MKKYLKPAVKVVAISAAEGIMALSTLDERGVYDVYAPVANFE